MNTASQYCKTLDNVSREELVNALHQALMQLRAAHDYADASLVLDHKPAIAEASRVLAKAGHVGFPICTPANLVTIDAKAKADKRSTLAP